MGNWTNRYIEFQFANISKNAKILDIACGDLREFNRLGFKNVIGVEFNEEKAITAQQTEYQGVITDMYNFDENEFDLVYSSHILEQSYGLVKCCLNSKDLFLLKENCMLSFLIQKGSWG